MRFFDGLDRTDYQDLLRSVGRQLDAVGARDLRLIETDAGLTLQTRHAGDRAAGFHTTWVAEDELLPLLRDTYDLRGRGTDSLPVTCPLGIPYQRWLRAIGGAADRAELRNLRVVEQPGSVLVQGTGPLLRHGYQTYRLTIEQLAVLAARISQGLPVEMEELSS